MGHVVRFECNVLLVRKRKLNVIKKQLQVTNFSANFAANEGRAWLEILQSPVY